VLGDQVVDTALQPLIDKRDRLLAESIGEQRKVVTVLFADLVDSTNLARRLDPEDLQQVMSRYFTVLRTAIQAEGGVVEKFIGDAVMAVFGLLRSREDDAVRAVRSGLAMLDAVEKLSVEVEAAHGLRLRMRVGMDTGEVLVTGMAGRTAGEFMVVGDTVNRSARLQAAAQIGTVLLSTETVNQVRGSFGLRRVPGLQLKGIDGPVDAYAVVSADERPEFWPEARGIEGLVTRTVGRGDELRRLQEVYAEVASSRSRRIVTVIGEAGVGKSRLVHDIETWLAALPTEVWVLRGRASPATQDVANGLLRSVFAERLRIRGTDDPGRVRRRWAGGWYELLGEPSSGGRAETVATWLGFALDEAGRDAVGTTDPEALRRRGSGLVLRLLERLGERAPVVVLLEDLHWADSASLDSLEDLAQAPGTGPLLVLATARPALLEQRPDWGTAAQMHEQVRLDPLDDGDARALVAELLQRADRVPARLVQLIVDTADGNPFYVEELVKWLIEEGVVDTSGERWRVVAEAVRQVRVPTTLRGLLQARLDSLEVPDRGVIGAAAVVGRVFWDDAVARLATSVPEPARGPAYERLTQREVIFERPHSTFSGSHEFSFRHALMRDVAYEGVLRSTRRANHALAAEWLEEVAARSNRPDEHAAAVAHHHEEAGAPVPAARWYLRAGRHAASTFANDDALRLLERARNLLPAREAALRAEVLFAREEVLDRQGRREEQRAVLDELLATKGLGPADRARTRLAEGRWHFFRGEYDAVPPLAEEAATLAREGDRPDFEAEALMQGGRAHAYRNRHDEARELLNRSLAKARAIGAHRRAGEALRLLGVVATNLGEMEEGLRLLEAAAEEHRRVHDREGEAMVTGQVGALLLELGRIEEARAPSEMALTVFVEMGHRYRQGVMLTNLARIAMEQGRLEDALELGYRALELTEAIDDAEGIVASLHSLGDAHRLSGDLRAARESLDRALEDGRTHDLGYFVVHTLASLAALALSEGRPDDAVGLAREAVTAAETADSPPATARAELLVGMTLAATGDPTAAERLRTAAGHLEGLGRRADRVEALAVLARVLRESGDAAGAGDAADVVLAELDAGVPPGIVLQGALLADVHGVLVAAGDPRAADVARRAGAWLRAQCNRITDDDLRGRYLTTSVATELARVAAED
jgi:class 3 adenylate cyclase/tetratricopeptide (TPR) repeat protein